MKKVTKFINDNREEIANISSIASSALGIKQGTIGQIGNAIGSIIPGPAGAAIQVASQFAGTGDHRFVNEQTGEIEGDNGTGIVGGIQKLFNWGRSTNSLLNKQSRIKTSLADQQLTQDLNYNFYQDPNNSMNGSIFATAAEGGIMRRPVNVLVSKGELIYDPATKKLSKVPGSKGKPNRKDDVPLQLAEGSIVVSNSPTMKMANGKTPAQNLEGLIDTTKNTKAKEAIIKKVVNWQEANKTNPTEYAKFYKGGPVAYKTPSVSRKIEDTRTLADIFKIPLKKHPETVTKTEEQKNKFDWKGALQTLSDYAPMISAELADYSYETDPKFSYTPSYLNTGVNAQPLFNQANEEYALARYNTANLSGAGIPSAIQAATNRRKAMANAYQWQQDTQRNIMNQNVGIKNEWAMRDAAAAQTAYTNTQQNKAAAMMAKDQAKKDAYEFQTGRRNDRWKLSMMEPMMRYAVNDEIWKKFKMV